MFEGVSTKHLVEYFAGVFRVFLSFLGINFDNTTSKKFGDLFDELLDYEPEV